MWDIKFYIFEIVGVGVFYVDCVFVIVMIWLCGECGYGGVGVSDVGCMIFCVVVGNFDLLLVYFVSLYICKNFDLICLGWIYVFWLEWDFRCYLRCLLNYLL